MYLIVRSIDFAKHAISLEVDRSITMSRFDHLQHYLDYCAALGYTNIDIFYPTHMPVMAFVMLQQLQKEQIEGSAHAPSEGSDDPADKSSASCHFEVLRSMGDAEEPVGYRLRFIASTNTLERLTTAVLLLGASIPLDDKSLSHLRLCVYELAANTLEHGEFPGGTPEIAVSFWFSDSHVIVDYRDNAEPFSTACEKTIDVGEKIKNRSKRGLGLFLLHRITEDLEYQRVGAENSTRFKVERKDQAGYDLIRRTEMNTLSITTTPIGSGDTIVIKPAGSVNSTTVPQLDAAFSEVRSAGHNTLVIDLSETDFISSSGVGLLLGTVATLREQGGDLVLMRIPKLVNDIFDVLNIKMHFRIVNNLSELKVTAKP
jgi:anti-anti-sigma factor